MSIKKFNIENINKSKLSYKKIVCLLLFILFVTMFAKKTNESIRKFYNAPKQMTINSFLYNGYSQNGTLYINEIGDAYIQLPLLSCYLNDIEILFSEPIKQPLNITVYYENEAHGYTEDHTASVTVNKGDVKARLFVGKDVVTCRLDIGSEEGEFFRLENIVINTASVSFESIKNIVWAFLLVLVLLTIHILVFTNQKTERIFAGLAFCIGLFYLFLITPLAVSDEPHHYQSSYQLSNYLLFQNPEYGDSTDFDYEQYVGHWNVSSGYERMINDIGMPRKEGSSILIPKPRNLDYFIAYLPQSLGIAVGRLFKLNFTSIFFVGRFFNLIFYSLCIYYSVKEIPHFKTMLGLISIMPMSLHQAASYSYDGFINGMSFVLIALVLQGIYKQGTILKKEMNRILLISALLIPAKVVYLPILFMLFLIPKNKFPSEKSRLKEIFIVFLANILILVFWRIQLLHNFTLTSDTLNWMGEHNYNLSFVFNHPIYTVEIFVRTLYCFGWHWVKASIGYALCGQTLFLPVCIAMLYMIILWFSALNIQGEEKEIALKNRLWLLFISVLVVFLVMLALFLGWTSNTSTVVLGIQGRYFIPIIPLLTIALSNNVVVLKKNISRYLIFASLFLNIATISQVVNYTLVH